MKRLLINTKRKKESPKKGKIDGFQKHRTDEAC
jgi:hypothetical protein